MEVILLFVGTSDVSINLQRAKSRVKKGGHDVPLDDQVRRYPRSMANFKTAFGLADEATVFDNSTPKRHTRVAVKDAVGVPAWAAFLREL